jgi:hypothetical protein
VQAIELLRLEPRRAAVPCCQRRYFSGLTGGGLRYAAPSRRTVPSFYAISTSVTRCWRGQQSLPTMDRISVGDTGRVLLSGDMGTARRWPTMNTCS